MEKSSAKRILISGYYGFGNTGDEAILTALLALLRRSPRVDLTVISARPEHTAREHHVRSVSRLNPLAIGLAMHRADLLISGGGGLLQDVTSSRSLLYYLSVIRMGSRPPHKVVLLAQSVGPIRTPFGRSLTYRTLNRVDLITVRDEHSARELASLGVNRPPVQVTADLALLLEPASAERGRELLGNLDLRDKPFLIFCLRSLKGRAFPLETFAALGRILQRELDVTVLYLPFQSSFDLEVSRELAQAVPQSTFLASPLKPPDLIRLFAQAQLVVGMRLHSLVFAAKARTPFLPLSYDPKVTAFAELLGIESLPFSPFDPEKFIGKLRQVWHNRGTIKEELSCKVEALEFKAEENWECLRKVLPELE